MVGDSQWYQWALNEPCVQEALNNYLADYPYLDGYTPSQLDSTVHQSLKELNTNFSNHLHLTRWYNHFATFTVKEKAVLRVEQNKIIPQLTYKCRQNSSDTFQVISYLRTHLLRKIKNLYFSTHIQSFYYS